jgi:hypothetical protein
MLMTVAGGPGSYIECDRSLLYSVMTCCVYQGRTVLQETSIRSWVHSHMECEWDIGLTRTARDSEKGRYRRRRGIQEFVYP